MHWSVNRYGQADGEAYADKIDWDLGKCLVGGHVRGDER